MTKRLTVKELKEILKNVQDTFLIKVSTGNGSALLAEVYVDNESKEIHLSSYN